jgi:anti-sigma factor RsiW
MTTCRELVERLLEFVAGELTDDERCRCEEHVRQCPPCAAYVATYQLTVRAAKRVREAPLPPDVAQRLRARWEAALREGL